MKPQDATAVKMICAAVLFIVWAVIVGIGKAEVAPLIEFIKFALMGLGAHTVFNKDTPP